MSLAHLSGWMQAQRPCHVHKTPLLRYECESLGLPSASPFPLKEPVMGIQTTDRQAWSTRVLAGLKSEQQLHGSTDPSFIPWVGHGAGLVPSGKLHPEQENWPHMAGWEVEGVSSEISVSHSQWVSHHLLRSLGGDGSLGASQSPWNCLGTCCNSCSFVWPSAREKQEGTHEVLGDKP